MKKQILIVEDEILLALDLKQILTDFGYEIVSIENNGNDAINAVEALKPNLVLMDICLNGEMNGIEAAQHIHNQYNIPVVYLTSNSNTNILNQAQLTAPYAFIIKPYNHRELFTHIEIALHKHQVEKRLAHLNSVLKAIKSINQLIMREKKKSPLIKGVCDLLIKTESCDTAWIITTEDHSKFLLSAHSGKRDEYTILSSTLNTDKQPDCILKAISHTNALIKKDNIFTCYQCPLYNYHKNKGTIAARLKYDNIIYGVLNVTITAEFIDLVEEKELIKEVADDIAFALHKIELEKERKKLEMKLHKAAITDELTGLYNRRGFFTLAEQQHKFAIRTKGSMALLYIDLDNLKTINDKYGHKVGDDAIVDTANVLKNSFRQSDIIARIGGDEFAVLLIEHQRDETGSAVTTNINKKLQHFNQHSHQPYKISLSMGMSYFTPENPCSISDLLIKADAAMYEEKKYRHFLCSGDDLINFKNIKTTQNRKYPRLNVYNYWLKLPGMESCKIKNISRGGICVKSFKELPLDSIFELNILPSLNKNLLLKGKVIWLITEIPSHKLSINQRTYDIGIQFVSLNDFQEKFLNHLILRLSQ